MGTMMIMFAIMAGLAGLVALVVYAVSRKPSRSDGHIATGDNGSGGVHWIGSDSGDGCDTSDGGSCDSGGGDGGGGGGD